MTVGASRYDRKANEAYWTERWATEALLRHLPVDGDTIWEPAAGNCRMADVLADHGAMVLTSDIAQYDRVLVAYLDFFAEVPAAPPFDQAGMIITNPPYGKGNRMATKFAELALKRCRGWVCLLLTAKWDSGKSRLHLTRDNPRFHTKIVLVDRISWEGNGKTGTEDHCWFVWQPDGDPWREPSLLYEGKVAG